MLSISEIVELRANGLGIPIFSPIHSNGVGSVSSVHLIIRFSLQNSSIWVERKIYDTATSLLSITLRGSLRVADNGSSMWELCAGKYKVYGLPDPSTNVFTEFRTPPHSFPSTFNTPPLVKVKIELGLHTVTHLFYSSNGDEASVSTPIPKPSPSSIHSTVVTLPLVFLFLHPLLNPPNSILKCLRTLVSMPDRKNILKKFDSDTLLIEEVNFLPPRFDENRMFVLLSIGVSSSHTKAKSMDGMNKRFDGHV